MCINSLENAAEGELCKNWSRLLICFFLVLCLALAPYRLFWQVQKHDSEAAIIHRLPSALSKIWAPCCDLKDPRRSDFCLTLWPYFIPLSFSCTIFQPHWPSCFSSIPSLFLSQGIVLTLFSLPSIFSVPDFSMALSIFLFCSQPTWHRREAFCDH